MKITAEPKRTPRKGRDFFFTKVVSLRLLSVLCGSTVNLPKTATNASLLERLHRIGVASISYLLRIVMHIIFPFILTILMSSCSKETPINQAFWQEICGRDNPSTSDQRMPIYRVKVPATWIRQPQNVQASIANTTLPLCEFHIVNEIRITIHNFPSKTIEERIPPMAQIHRWKQQIQSLDPLNMQVIPLTCNGYCGLYFEGLGYLNGKESIVMGWSLQLASEHYRTLSYWKNATEAAKHKQMQADITIKVVGPKEQIEQHKPEILKFARTFELIEEIPSIL